MCVFGVRCARCITSVIAAAQERGSPGAARLSAEAARRRFPQVAAFRRGQVLQLPHDVNWEGLRFSLGRGDF